MDNTQLDLSLIDLSLRKQALQCWEERDIFGVLIKMDNMANLAFVCDNHISLKKAGLFEDALLHAFIICRLNNMHISKVVLDYLFFDIADRTRLLSAGDPLPGNGPFTLYRGVAGKGAARRVRGLSWTADLELAKWFSSRYAYLSDPVVFKAIIPVENIYAYINERKEQEFICYIPKDMKLTKIPVKKG
ncbi:MAG TPA: hypothetical protein DDW94_09655 [Deltaproteobacteria bacterium]|nr:MAG: hypothetical protein A2Z79_12255 [Deltaproteobacteria bacterium GWA2_55_82]OGQ63945.1 MAG: hypothetical protein A3I81_07785 [Deltaproteobacteria bacterium RIFCSPLOWO2_02_FULL_55_12]OIJ73377.1 MAG: hypothetical protein A2V21_303325 [Deltaproteobacteria bacterium GWC2_55_46]HBG47237.1 hypothetical protein [Deltaproteobacteria bacterium]HCY10003.1 hypothetical protein [Deltaproteobacteria bacterium]